MECTKRDLDDGSTYIVRSTAVLREDTNTVNSNATRHRGGTNSISGTDGHGPRTRCKIYVPTLSHSPRLLRHEL